MYKSRKYFAEYLPVIKSEVLNAEHAQIPGYPLVKDHWYYIHKFQENIFKMLFI